MSKKIEVFYNEHDHHFTMSEGYRYGEMFKKAVTEIEGILGRPLTSYAEFRKDIPGYALKEIKAAFPKPFELLLSDEATLKMLSISLDSLKNIDAGIPNDLNLFNVCPKTGKCSPNEDKEPFKWYAETPEQLERLQLANEVITVLNKAHKVQPQKHKAGMTIGLDHIVYFNGPTDQLLPNHYWVMNGFK